jgi:hypothetical protein
MVQISPRPLGGEKQKHVSALLLAFVIRLGGFDNKQTRYQQRDWAKDYFEIASNVYILTNILTVHSS